MAGGIAIFLAVVVFVLLAIVGIALYLTGGALWFGKTSPKGDRVEGDVDGEGQDARPRFRHVDQPEEERVRLAGTPAGEGRERE